MNNEHMIPLVLLIRRYFVLVDLPGVPVADNNDPGGGEVVISLDSNDMDYVDLDSDDDLDDGGVDGQEDNDDDGGDNGAARNCL